MNYVALDIETTGLDPNKHRIVEFAAIIDNGGPIDKLPRFRRILKQEDAIWSLYCIKLHEDWYFDSVKNEDDPELLHTEFNLMSQFLQWFYSFHDMKTKILLAGKNVGAFDLQFVKRLPDYNGRDFRHRVLDPAMLYLGAEDLVPPDLKTCMVRAGLPYDEKLAHTALYDAECVVRLLRSRMPQNVMGED